MDTPDSRLRGQIGLFVLVRLVVNTSYRMLYPFLPVFARGLGVDLGALSVAFSVRSASSILGPLLAPLADRRGRRFAMLLGLGLFSLGAGLVALHPAFLTFSIALILTNLGNFVFLSAMQAYLGDRIAYERRGSALAVTELSWSLAFLLTVPGIGFLFARAGWSAAYPLLAGAGLVCMALVARFIPDDRGSMRPVGALWSGLGAVIASRQALAALSVSLLVSMANETVNFVFGVWMEDAFGLQIAALGAASLVIGAAELAGEGGTALLVDRLGKQRSVVIGLGLVSLAGVALPLLGRSLPGALAGLFLFYLGFEFSLVSFLPLMSEVLPHARAALMATNLAAFAFGRGLGALIAPPLYAWGFLANALAAVALNLLALFFLSRLRLK